MWSIGGLAIEKPEVLAEKHVHHKSYIGGLAIEKPEVLAEKHVHHKSYSA
jgi:hypothetical protein